MTAYQASSAEAYQKLGLTGDSVEAWEDGLRTDPDQTSFEWWYFDAHFDDGSTLVVVFSTKPMLSPALPLTPRVTVNFDRPDGTHLVREIDFAPDEFAASTTVCDVRIGPNRFVGDLDRYSIRVDDKGLTVDVTLERTTRSWRPATGHMYFDDGTDAGRKFFAYLPAVPDGQAEATVTVDGHSTHLSGTGYHDHNWGDAPMNELMHHWWWGRAKVGPFVVITAFITAEQIYGGGTIPIFFLSRDGTVLSEAGHIGFAASPSYVDDYTGKPVAKRHRYEYSGPDGHFRVTWVRENDIFRLNLNDIFDGEQRDNALAAGYNPSYLRFTGTAKIERLENGTPVETHTAPAIWDLMYFGQPQLPADNPSPESAPTLDPPEATRSDDLSSER
ncbi:hydroxyneurosporene dehydrogenase [Rhodococcus sp. T2V]|uniref:hydroxyneurosporene dehydrogenase n=1 Tax=Rhodococcus sp. T2V TaxID=3034164 RepID=UPI0023E1EBF4|nr:hydroxyneurosporene dehydrogenase [Rhodococcus sp. T2V]MDF3311896.1 hydroxyneurosporene dehydrogenase [Rhodococcus sp. T2V]